MEAINENKSLRLKIRAEQKKQQEPCKRCADLKQKLRKSQDEMEFAQEMYFGQKTQYNEETSDLRLKLQ